MQIGESVAIPAFTMGTDDCPLLPHSTEEGFEGKPPGEKSVALLRKSMQKGWTTRQWKQDGDAFSKEEEQIGPKKGAPIVGVSPIEIASVSYPLSIAAHHIIPGKASLPGSGLAKYLWKSKGLIQSDVGYDCDGSENGIWLPTHQLMSRKLGKKQDIVIHDDDQPLTEQGLSWAELSEKSRNSTATEQSYNELFLLRYTQQAMIAVNAQFHDSHSDYNKLVTQALDRISAFIDKKIEFCDECSKSDKKSPPYLLVYRLNSLSKRIATRFLKGMPWAGWKKVYTSNFSSMYASQPLQREWLR